MEIIAIVVMIAAVIAVIGNVKKTAAAAQTPGDMTAAMTENLAEKTNLYGGPWIITFHRHSGNVHRVDTAETPEEAVRKVQAAFRRAKIDLVRLSNTDTIGFTAMRAIHNGRGRAEGKKLGGATVSRAR